MLNNEIMPGTLLLDRTMELAEPDVLYPFALEELLCRYIGEGGPPIVHLWRHPRALVMGLRDSRLPSAAAASAALARQGYAVAVRNSGGAAVPLDLGVVNVTWMLPLTRRGQLDFRDDFERMYRLIAAALTASGGRVDKGEIAGAYCPGDYDLSIGGRKFCGIAQRRQAHAYAIQAFVVVEGSGAEKAELARSFYAAASAGGTGGEAYPRVEADRMGSLRELIGYAGGAEGFAAAVKQVVRGALEEGAGGTPAGAWAAEPVADGAHEQGAGGTSAGAGAAGPLPSGAHPGEARGGAGYRAPWLPTREEVLAMAAALRQRYGIKEMI